MSAPLKYDAQALAAECDRLGLRRVILFGSYATGMPAPGPDSDVDLAVSFYRDRERTSVWDLHGSLGSVFEDQSLDIVLVSDADPLFRWEIMSDAVLLHGDELDFLELRAFAFRDFVDSADLRRLEATLFEKKMAIIRQRLNAAA
jgi:predicted nucleotidyltransferase